MADKKEKTNVMRLLDSKKIEYKSHDYSESGVISGEDVASFLGEDKNRVFKTLVTVSSSRKNYVFVIPVSGELDLKKAAKAAGEKKIEMIKSKELLALTGYIHGGCSPIGMKKFFPTFVDKTAENFETIFFSAGKIGWQVEMPLLSLKKIIKTQECDLI